MLAMLIVQPLDVGQELLSVGQLESTLLATVGTKACKPYR